MNPAIPNAEVLASADTLAHVPEPEIQEPGIPVASQSLVESQALESKDLSFAQRR